MSRGGSVGRIWVARKGRCEVQFLKNGYAPTAHMGIVMNDRYYRTLAAAARVGAGYFLTQGSLPACQADSRDEKLPVSAFSWSASFPGIGRKAVLAPENGAWYNSNRISEKNLLFSARLTGYFCGEMQYADI